MNERRCEARTLKGPRCKVTTNLAYHRHTDGEEYLCCRRHDNENFRPRLKIREAPPDHPIYTRGYVIGGIGRNRLPENTQSKSKRKPS